MSTMVPELPTESRESFGDDLAGMGSFFIDPAGAARRIPTKWFWVGPLILFSVVGIIAAHLLIPITQRVMETMPVPPNANPEQFQKGLELSIVLQRIFVWLAPITTLVIYCFDALILFAVSAALAVKAKFRELFNLVAGCSLIQMVAAIASVIVLKAKGDISTLAELRPAMGIDIFLPEGTNRFVMAFLGYFTVFEIWWIVMLVLIFSKAFHVSKGKAFAVVLPLICLSVIFRVLGAAFQRT